ncbi:odorant receptor 13a-like [Spodoptera litura]|uniref:Odorant receptor n=1 Tax=Spodoptera litura TaxID=69820 RepID=A0A9J7E702_SPOLT|nr:odorant receptor 13a-like [Spodoptera litura]
MDATDLIFKELFKIRYVFMRLNRSHPSIARDRRWKFQFSIIMMIIFSHFFFLSYPVFYHDIRSGNFAIACLNASITIICITVTLKYIILLYHQESIKELKTAMERDYADAQEFCNEDKEIVVQYAKRGVTVCKFWLVFGFGSSTIFPIKAIVLTGYYYWKGEFVYVHIFDLTYPQPIEDYKNVTICFWLLFVFNNYFGLLVSSMFVGFDPMVPIFMLHTCGQLDLLSRHISTLFVDANIEEIEEGLKKIISKQQDLCKLVDSVNKNFSILHEYNMKATTFTLPLTTFQIVEDLRQKRITIIFVAMFAAAILHFFMPCYYSDLLMEKSEKFRQAIYSCGWEKCPDRRIRQIILFMLTRTRIPLGITTVFYEISLDTFAEMCRQSYAILSLMNAAWK